MDMPMEAMESALSVLSDPAVLGLEAALFTAWALAEIRLQKTANQAKEIINDKTKELWATDMQPPLVDGASPVPTPEGFDGKFLSMASTFESLSLDAVYGSLPSMPRMALPNMPTMPQLPAFPSLPFSLATFRANMAAYRENELQMENTTLGKRPSVDIIEPLTTHPTKISRINSSDVHAAVVEHMELNTGTLLHGEAPNTTSNTTNNTLNGLPESIVQPSNQSLNGPYDSNVLKEIHRDEKKEIQAIVKSKSASAPTRQKRKPRTREQLERCRQESARARERKKFERSRLQQVVAQRTEDCERLQESVRALQSEAEELRKALLEGNLSLLEKIPDMEPNFAQQALLTAQLCASALETPNLMGAVLSVPPVVPFQGAVSKPASKAPAPLRVIRPRPSTDDLAAAATRAQTPATTPSLSTCSISDMDISTADAFVFSPNMSAEAFVFTPESLKVEQ